MDKQFCPDGKPHKIKADTENKTVSCENCNFVDKLTIVEVKEEKKEPEEKNQLLDEQKEYWRKRSVVRVQSTTAQVQMDLKDLTNMLTHADLLSDEVKKEISNVTEGFTNLLVTLMRIQIGKKVEDETVDPNDKIASGVL